MVSVCTGSLKVAWTVVRVDTPVASGLGLCAVRVGAVVSATDWKTTSTQ